MEKKLIISVRGLLNQFGDHVVHDHLDFDLYSSEIVGVVGGNGMGKSVLLRTIIGLQHPTAGEVFVRGRNIYAMDEKDRLAIQRTWGVLFQKGALFSNLTVVENVAFQLREKTTLSEKEILSLARMRIDMVGLPKLAGDKYPSELSGGMTKRAALARALVLDPQILFLDEPTAGLDSVAADLFDQLLRDLVNELGISVFMITHDLDSLNNICDRIAVLIDKKIITGTLDDMLQNQHPWVHEYFHNRRARFMTRG